MVLIKFWNYLLIDSSNFCAKFIYLFLHCVSKESGVIGINSYKKLFDFQSIFGIILFSFPLAVLQKIPLKWYFCKEIGFYVDFDKKKKCNQSLFTNETISSKKEMFSANGLRRWPVSRILSRERERVRNAQVNHNKTDNKRYNIIIARNP